MTRFWSKFFSKLFSTLFSKPLNQQQRELNKHRADYSNSNIGVAIDSDTNVIGFAQDQITHVSPQGVDLICGFEGLELKRFEQAVTAAVNVPLNQNQFDALVSLSYNIGIGAFKNSTLLKLLNASDYHAASDQFDVWIKAGGKTVQGLVNRRAVEKLLFNS